MGERCARCNSDDLICRPCSQSAGRRVDFDVYPFAERVVVSRVEPDGTRRVLYDGKDLELAREIQERELWAKP